MPKPVSANSAAWAGVSKILTTPNERTPESHFTHSPSTRSAPTYSRMAAPGFSARRTFCGPMGLGVLPELRVAPAQRTHGVAVCPDGTMGVSVIVI